MDCAIVSKVNGINKAIRLVYCCLTALSAQTGYRGVALHPVFRRINFSGRHIGGIGCSSTLLIIFISPIMVVQKSTKQSKIKYLFYFNNTQLEKNRN